MSDLWQTPALVDTTIWHGRSGDATRRFRYRATYLTLPLKALEAGTLPIRLDGGGPWTLRARDYGARDGSSLHAWADTALAPHGLAGAEITLVTLPRTAGYGFNPVSFWLARKDGALRAVLTEVSNTFGERHVYSVRHPDGAPIAPTDRLRGDKLFHVSPFLPRAGHYVFRFDAGPGRFGGWVDWVAEDGSARLGTSMVGPARPLTAASLRRAAWTAPFAAQKVMALIHLQAAQLALRGLRYRQKPEQLATTRSDATQPGRPHV